MRILLLIIAVLLLNACATYGDWIGQMEDGLARQDPGAALEIMERRAGERERDAALLSLNRAMLLRMQGDYESSSSEFEAAKAIIDELLAVSLTEQAGALAISDDRRSFIGEPFERAFIHVYAALNYLESGAPEKARVEALQLDVLLNGFERDAGFSGDGLARWLSGMIFESLGDRSDAMIAYRKAWEAYQRYPASSAVQIPEALGRDLVRLSGSLGLSDEQRRFREQFAIDEQQPSPRPGEAEVIFLLHSGLAPIKRETGIAAPTTGGRLVSIAVPYYLSRRPSVTGATLVVDGRTAVTELAEDIDALALDALDRRLPAIMSRAVARAVIKHEASRQASRENELIGFIVNIAGFVSERADTRSWSTLPNRIYLARMPLPPGEHAITIELRDRLGRVEERQEHQVTLAAGDRHFISVHRVTREDLNRRQGTF